MRLKQSILAVSMMAALLSWGCPMEDPLTNASSEAAARQVDAQCAVHPTLPQCAGTGTTTSGAGTPISVPEPGTLALVGAGLCWLLWQRRR
jgi:hypothetical protein